MDYKPILGYIATAIAIASYLIYFWGIYKRRTKPHAFTWFVWGTLNVIGFAAVLTGGGGEGAWVLAVNVIGCYGIATIGFYQRHVQYDKYDWMALGGGLLGGIFWYFTKNPLYAVVLITISDCIGIIPSFRKAYRLPFEENPFSFSVGVLYYFLALFALEHFTPTTALYHVVIMLADGTFAIMILIRRKQLANHS